MRTQWQLMSIHRLVSTIWVLELSTNFKIQVDHLWSKRKISQALHHLAISKCPRTSEMCFPSLKSLCLSNHGNLQSYTRCRHCLNKTLLKWFLVAVYTSHGVPPRDSNLIPSMVNSIFLHHLIIIPKRKMMKCLERKSMTDLRDWVIYLLIHMKSN